MKKTIVVVGAGFGGIYTCKYLLKEFKNKKIEIILINKSNYFVFTPILHEVATGGINIHSSIEPIREVLKAKNFKFIRSEVKEINLNKRQVILDHIIINYDQLVISVGSQTNFFDIKGAEKYTIPLKSLYDASKIRKKIINSLEESLNEENEKIIKELLTFVIVGGGPTGVELAAEIEEFISQNLKYNYRISKDLINIIIVQRPQKILPELDESCIKLVREQLEKKNIKILYNSAVTEVNEDNIIINNKDKINTKNVIWTAGVTPNFIKTVPKITDQKNYFHVNKFLQVKNFENVFSLGDCALFYDENKKEYAPALAQVAVKQAKIVSNNIIAILNNKQLRKYNLRLMGFLVSVGQGFGVAHIFGIHFKGRLAWFIWRTVYFFKIIGIKNKIRVGIEWALNLFFRRDINEV